MDKSGFVLVTGATGFIGAHIVDALLARIFRVRGATRSLSKGQYMIQARPEHAQNLEFVQIDDFQKPGGLFDAAKGVDAVIHTASVRGTLLRYSLTAKTTQPFTYDTTDNVRELIS